MNFEDELNSQIEWRMLELSNLKLELDNTLKVLANNPLNDSGYIFRGVVVLLYSHLEGTIFDLSSLYIDYLNQNIVANIRNEKSFFVLSLIMERFKENKELQNAICGIKSISKMYHKSKISFSDFLKYAIEELNNTHTIKLKDINKKYIQNLINILEENRSDSNQPSLKINKNVIDTKLNLGYEEYIKVINLFYINEPNIISLRIRMQQLLSERNEIAHGKKRHDKIRVAQVNDYIQNLETIMELINYTKNELLKKID